MWSGTWDLSTSALICSSRAGIGFSNGLEFGRAYENAGICNHQALACPDTRWGYADQSFLESCKSMGSIADSMEQINWEMDNLLAG